MRTSALLEKLLKQMRICQLSYRVMCRSLRDCKKKTPQFLRARQQPVLQEQLPLQLHTQIVHKVILPYMQKIRLLERVE